ncbi:unnamed protein product [Hymenolepis diminuta]|nr:unnamed protein product [Hymenolepis diminuta]
MRLHFGYILLLLSCFGLCSGDATETVGKIELQLKYSNTGHYSSTGWCDIIARTCDVYFIVCVWSGDAHYTDNCNVAKKNTHIIGPYSKIQTSVELPLTSPVPKSVYFRVEAWDSDYTSSDDLIGKFDSAEAPLSSTTEFHTLNLTNRDVTIYNSHVKIDAFYGLTCSLHYYGPQCQTYCKSNFKTYHCGENGERKCLPGWYGELCNKADMCFLKPCAPYARCSNTDTEEGRICYCNDGSGPECYQVPDPCEPPPCKNGGVCSKTGPHLEQFVCECKKSWYGPTCEQRYSACALKEQTLRAIGVNSSEEVCLNGGICQDDPIEFDFTCACPSGWKGEHCEERDYSVAIAVPITLIIILIIIAVLLFFLWRKRK